MNNNLLFIFILFVSLLGLIVSVILYFANKNQSLSPRVLALTVFSISYVLIGFGWYFSGTYLEFPHLWRTPVFFSQCIPPLCYLYVRSVLEQQLKFRKTDLLFFVPAVLYTLQLIPFFVKPESEKYEVVARAIADKTLIALEPEGMLPLGTGIIFRNSFGLTMVIMQALLIGKYRKKVLGQLDSPVQNRQILNWLGFFTLVMGTTFFILIIEFIFQVSRFLDIYELLALTVCGTILFISFYLLFRPNILYGLKGWFQDSGNVMETIKVAIVPPDQAIEEMEAAKKQSLSIEQGRLYKIMIENHFKKGQPFRKPGYAIRDLSIELSIPTYQLSAFINQEYGKNFNEFVNESRVGYLEQLVEVQPEYMQYTLEALGQVAGFNSRTAFISAVKKKTGKTPSELFGKKNGR